MSVLDLTIKEDLHVWINGDVGGYIGIKLNSVEEVSYIFEYEIRQKDKLIFKATLDNGIIVNTEDLEVKISIPKTLDLEKGTYINKLIITKTSGEVVAFGEGELISK